MNSSVGSIKPDGAESIKQKRLSDDTTTNSSSDSEEEIQPQSSPMAPSPMAVEDAPLVPEKSIREWTWAELLANDDKMQEYLESFPEIKGKYTRDDPGYAAEEDEEENSTPPIMPDYRPRQYGRGGYNQGNQYNRGYQRGGGRGNYSQQNDRNYSHNNRGGGGYRGNRGDSGGYSGNRGGGGGYSGNRGSGGYSGNRGGGGGYQGNRNDSAYQGSRGAGDRHSNEKRGRDQSGETESSSYNSRAVKAPRFDHSNSSEPQKEFVARPPAQGNYRQD